MFCVSPGRLLQEGLEGEDGGGVQEGQLGLRPQERRQGEHFLTAAVTSDLRAALCSCAQFKEPSGRTDGRTDRGPVNLAAPPTARLEKTNRRVERIGALFKKKRKERKNGEKRDAHL